MKNSTEISKATTSTKKRSRLKRVFILLACGFVLLPALLIGIAAGGYAIWASGQHIDAKLLPTALSAPTFYDVNGNEIYADEDSYVKQGEAPQLLKDAFVAVEDKRFYKHKGYDVVRIAGAIVKNIKSKNVAQGASTITQQLVKNTHLTSERSISRKLREIALARDLERKYSKDDILNMYMSVIYFGSGAYGVKSAARTFFDADISELSPAQCATLAGVVKNPAGYSPVKHPEKCVERRDLVLGLMYEQGYLSKEEFDEAKAEKLTVKNGSAKGDPAGCKLYLAMAKKQAAEALGITEYQLDNCGVKIYTALDPDIQSALESERKNPSNFESENVSSAAIVIDNASGDVIALSSTYPYDILRQTGSVLKPLAVYAPALDMHSVSLATPIKDEKVDFNGFSPENFNGKYYGDTTIEEAIKRSMNSVSVKVLDYIGVDASAQYLKKFGISASESDKNYALALGALSASPVRVAMAYSALARGGNVIEPNFVKYVVLDGEKTSVNATYTSAVSPATAAIMTSALINTVEDGTARTLASLPFAVAAKTGTVEKDGQSNSDGWIAGYNKDCTVVVWHGSDSGMTERGGGYPAMHAKAIWQDLQSRFDFEKQIEIGDGAIGLDVDSYSTQKLKKVVLASKNTPIEYRKTQYFDIRYMPDSTEGLFENVSPCPLSLKVYEGHVELNFDALPIYRYMLFRTDVFGKALIYSAKGVDGEVSLSDVPIGFGDAVNYELVCALGENADISATTSKSVFFEPGYTDRLRLNSPLLA